LSVNDVEREDAGDGVAGVNFCELSTSALPSTPASSSEFTTKSSVPTISGTTAPETPGLHEDVEVFVTTVELEET
jgi:hypothetical protein